MPLPLPKLDTYTFDTLVADAHALLPRYAPVWTDYNAHDPGITLIELMAWITEMESYRLDRTTEASQRAFLRLVGIELTPAQVAETVFVVGQKGGGLPIQLPTGSQFTTGSNLTFQTASPLWISPAKLVAVLSGTATPLRDYTQSNVPSPKPFPPFGKNPQLGDALYLGFDRTLADNPAVINLYVWVGDPDAERQTRDDLKAEAKALQEEAKNCSPGSAIAVPDWSLHYSVRTSWEYYAGSDQWLPLLDVTDNTRAFTLSGEVIFTAPDPTKHAPGGVATAGESAHYFIRCRLTTGSYDCSPPIRFVQINTVGARHAADIASPVPLGSSSGQAGQVFSLPDNPIVPGSTGLQVQVGGTVEQDWNEQLWWDRVGPYDHGYVLDPESGRLTFGNGRAGAVPASGAQISAKYQVGGGSAGNVPANSPWSAKSAAPVTVSQPFPASGGAEAESLFDARARAVTWLTIPQRAVTLADFERLALETPGVPIARAKALADYDPQLHCIPAPGSVTVVVISKCTQSCPVPTPDLLRAVAQHLDRRRLVTTELHVIGSDYTAVTVQATLHTTPDVVSRDLISLATWALNDFLDPLKGGPEGKGWPIGRAVYRTEILARLNALPGVLYVDRVTLGGVTQGSADESTPACCSSCRQTASALLARCGNVEICPHGLVTPGKHQIAVSTERVAR